jgi:hypothetical protein
MSAVSEMISLERSDLESLEDPSEVERMTVLIVGDCVVAEDDALWQSKEFSQLDLGPGSDSQTDFLIPWFDPPLISPQPTVCAVPVSVTALDYAFGVAFGSTKRTSSGSSSSGNNSSNNSSNSNSSGHNTGGDSISSGNGSHSSSTRSGPVHSYLMGSTPLCGSSFSVLMYSSPDIPQTPCDSCDVKVADLDGRVGRCPSVCPPFGPHDFCTVREFLLGDYRVNKRSRVNKDTAKDKEHASVHDSESARPLNSLTHQKDFLPRIVAEHFSLNFLWNFIMKVGCVDSQLFVELRWVVIRAVLRLASAARARAVLVATRKATQQTMGVGSEEVTVQIYPQSLPEIEKGRETETVSEVLKEVRKWCDAAVACVRCHSCCSIAAVLQIRSRFSHWLLALCSALRKEIVPSHDHLHAATSSSGSENNLFRSHFDDELMQGSVYALQSLLSLHSASELLEGIGLDPLQETQALALELAFPNTITVPLQFCLGRCLFNNRAQTTLSEVQSSIPSAQVREGPQLMSDQLFIHCLSEGEAISCVAALLSLTRIAAQPGAHISGLLIHQVVLSEVILSSILPLCCHVVTTIHAKHATHSDSKTDKMDQDGLQKVKEKENVIAREKKLIRKMNRIIRLHTDAIGSGTHFHNLPTLP